MPQKHQNREENPTAAVVLSVIAGLWMVLMGTMGYGFGWHHMRGPRMGWVWCNGMLGHFTPVFLRPWFGVVTGIAVVVGAAMLYADPARARQWGLIIILASAISAFFGMGGLLAGLLGIVGGALAISAGNGGRPPLTRAQNEA